MDNKKYQWILYGIASVILVTIGIQIYWNYKNYLVNKQRFTNDVRVSLDNAVESYYTNLAKKNTLAIAFNSKGEMDSLLNFKMDSLHDFNLFPKELLQGNQLKMNVSKGVTIFSEIEDDSLFSLIDSTKETLERYAFTHPFDSSKVKSFKTLTTKVMISLASDSLSLNEIDSLFKTELSAKDISLHYNLEYKNVAKDTMKIKWISKPENQLLNATSQSPFLHTPSTLSVYFQNETLSILKRSLSGILISLLLVLAVIGSLFYLLKIIKHQKELAEVKNDLIGNITHEFKTPIATIGVALESIKDFDGISNTEKTKKYLGISEQQLVKLNTMVEKLLETATLDSENLKLNKNLTNISLLLDLLIERYKIQYPEKNFALEFPSEEIWAQVDGFHFENALNNLLDNAVKYGGKDIHVKTEQNHFSFTLFISDSGNTISKAHKEKVFEKFYRIPQGNRHDVKGFGIGLYYTKTIVEKHGGAIHLDLDKQETTFKVTLPYE